MRKTARIFLAVEISLFTVASATAIATASFCSAICTSTTATTDDNRSNNQNKKDWHKEIDQ